MTIAQQIRAGTSSPYFESGHRGVLGVEVTTRGGVNGAVVVSTTPADAAAAAGIVAGDVITTVAGLAVPSVADFNQVMQDRRPGDSVGGDLARHGGCNALRERHAGCRTACVRGS